MLFALAALLMQAAAPAVGAAPPKPSVITLPDWARRPSGADIAEFYPKAAAAARIEGRAVLHCRVAETGDLTDCAATNEAPSGQGFGDAALAMAGKFKMRPQTKDCVPVSGGQISIPIAFRLPPPPIPTTPVVMRCYGYAAAAAEQDPASPQAQAELAAWRLLIELKSIPEGQRPSEFEGLLIALQKTGAEHLKDAQLQPERDECARAMTATPEMVRNLTRLVGG